MESSRLKSFFYQLVDPFTGRVYHGWRYAVDRKAVKKIIRADYGKHQLITLRG